MIKREKNKGFTLIELLLAISIFSVISLSIYSTFASGMQLDKRSQQQNEVYREVRWTFDLLAKELENMRHYDFSASYPERAAFIGNDDDVQFVVAGEDGLKVIRYYLAAADSGEVSKVLIGDTYKKNVRVQTKTGRDVRISYLLREERDFIDFLSEDNAGESEIIATNIKEGGFRVSYGYLIDENSSSLTWSDQWNQEYFPLALHIEIDFVFKNKGVTTLSRDILVPHGRYGGSGESST